MWKIFFFLELVPRGKTGESLTSLGVYPTLQMVHWFTPRSVLGGPDLDTWC